MEDTAFLTDNSDVGVSATGFPVVSSATVYDIAGTRLIDWYALPSVVSQGVDQIANSGRVGIAITGCLKHF